MKNKNLITIRHYAEQKNLTPQAIYKQIRLGKLEKITIDGINFIEIQHVDQVDSGSDI